MTKEQLEATEQLKDGASNFPNQDRIKFMGTVEVFQKFGGNSELLCAALFDAGFSDDEIQDAMNGEEGMFAMFDYFKSKPELYPLR